MTDVTRFGLVGAGAMAQTWALSFRAAADVELMAVADVRQDAATAMAEPFGAAVFADVEQLAQAGCCDAVVVCSPPASHAEVALTLLASGINVLCEKPLAIDSESANKMVSAAADAGLLLTMASKFRFVEDVIRARGIVTSGLLGEMTLFSNSFASRVDMSNRWNADRAVSGGGVIIDNGTHSVDIARYLLGPVTEVLALDARHVQNLDVEDTAKLLVRTADGAVGEIELSWGVNSFANTYIEVIGTEGVLRVGWSRSRFRQAASPHWVDFGSGYDKVQAHARQLENFSAAIHGRAELLVPASDALASVAVIEAAYASIASGAWAPVTAC
jgi:predicted dehydrogenase